PSRHAGRAHAAGARRGVARRRVAHQALPRVAGRASLHPRGARPAAVSPPGAVRWRVARKRGRLDPSRRDRGQPRQRLGEPVARYGAGLGPADGARPRADRPRRGGPPPARRGTGVSGPRAVAVGGASERMGIYFVEPGADIRASRVVYDRAGSAFAAITPQTVDWAKAVRGAAWFHGSGITPALGEGPRASLTAAITAARAGGVRISLDLNYRPALWQGREPRAVIEPLVKGADLLIGNRDAVGVMRGSGAPDDSLGQRLAERDECRHVAVTPR